MTDVLRVRTRRNRTDAVLNPAVWLTASFLSGQQKPLFTHTTLTFSSFSYAEAELTRRALRVSGAAHTACPTCHHSGVTVSPAGFPRLHFSNRWLQNRPATETKHMTFQVHRTSLTHTTTHIPPHFPPPCAFGSFWNSYYRKQCLNPCSWHEAFVLETV